MNLDTVSGTTDRLRHGTTADRIDGKEGSYRQRVLRIIGILLLATTMSATAQHHFGNWVHRNANDTTIIPCLYDSASTVAFPPNCLGMGMMNPDSIYCRFEYLPLDSLPYPMDSTFLCWRRLQIGSDSDRFDFMRCGNDDGGHGMMNFLRDVRCRIRWDSQSAVPWRRSWRPTGVKGWNGASWVDIGDASIVGPTATVVTSRLYSALALTGAPSGILDAGDEAQAVGRYTVAQPSTNSVHIRFVLQRGGPVLLQLFDLTGRPIETLLDGRRESGDHVVEFDGSGIPSGVAFVRIQTREYTAVRSVVFIH